MNNKVRITNGRKTISITQAGFNLLKKSGWVEVAAEIIREVVVPIVKEKIKEKIEDIKENIAERREEREEARIAEAEATETLEPSAVVEDAPKKERRKRGPNKAKTPKD